MSDCSAVALFLLVDDWLVASEGLEAFDLMAAAAEIGVDDDGGAKVAAPSLKNSPSLRDSSILEP